MRIDNDDDEENDDDDDNGEGGDIFPRLIARMGKRKFSPTFASLTINAAFDNQRSRMRHVERAQSFRGNAPRLRGLSRDFSPTKTIQTADVPLSKTCRIKTRNLINGRVNKSPRHMGRTAPVLLGESGNSMATLILSRIDQWAEKLSILNGALEFFKRRFSYDFCIDRRTRVRLSRARSLITTQSVLRTHATFARPRVLITMIKYK